MLNEVQQDLLLEFIALEPWKYQELVKYTWHLNPMLQTRDLELWLCEKSRTSNRMSLKLYCYAVNEETYSSVISTGMTLQIKIEIGESTPYMFNNIYDQDYTLFECQDFKAWIEEVDYIEL